MYVNLKLARDTLVDPAKRFAYDRFGPEMLQWRHCKTIRDYVILGVQRTAAYYIGSFAVLIVIGVLGYMNNGKFWRYLVMSAFFAIEVSTTTRPEFPALLTGLINPLMTMTRLRSPYLPFQMLALLRKVAITIFIALSQLGPLLQGPNAGEDGDVISPQKFDRLDALTKVTDQEIKRLMSLDLSPFTGDRSNEKELRKGLKEWLVQNSIRNDQGVNKAINEVLSRRRQEDGHLPG